MLWLYCSGDLNRAVVGVIIDVLLCELIMMGLSWPGEMQDPSMVQWEILSRVGRNARVVSEMAGESSFARVVGVIFVLELWDTKLVEMQGGEEDDACF